MRDPEKDRAHGDREPILVIAGERVSLGPWRKDLLPLFCRWVNDLPTARGLGSTPPMTLEQEERWYEEEIKSEKSVGFTVYERPALRPIGSASLFDIDHRNRSAGFGILIGEPKARNRGFGTEATRLMLDYAFNVLGLHNVVLGVYEFNGGAVRAYEKAGFKEIGRRRECYVTAGRAWDEILMDCLSTEFGGSVLGGPDA